MEIPEELKQLYKHWPKHTKQLDFTNTKIELDPQVLEKMKYLINERMKVYELKQTGAPAPWTNDPILQKYRFCNIYRELDRQTIEIHKTLKPLLKDFKIWLLNLAFCRFIARPETNSQVGSLSFDKQNNSKVYEKLMNLPRPKYGTAYLFPISVIQKSSTPTREEFLCFHLPAVMSEIADIIENFNNLSVNQALPLILNKFGFNFWFHWTEILIDVAYQFPNLIELRKGFHIGPGAMPTFKTLSNANPVEVADSLASQVFENLNWLELDGMPIWLSAENWEGIGCEFRKYMNLAGGNGRKRIYNNNG
ncbi:MAG: hypothetical protein Fur003_0810 [Candidatus Dojkabacteria bacterium]